MNDTAAALNDTLAALRREIAEAERRLHLTLDAAGASGAWHWDIVAGVLRADARYAALTGQDPVQLADGVPPSRFFHNIHPEDRKRIRLAVAGILAGAEVFAKDYRLIREDGGTRWVHASGHAILDAEDRPIRFRGDVVDITEQKRIQEQLRIAQSAGRIGTFEHAEGFGTVSVSSQFCELLGLHPTRILPVATVNGLVHPEDRPIIEPILPPEPVFEPNVEFRITRADTGEPRWLARRGEYVRDLAGPGLRYIGVAYDITAAKLTEEKLRKANEGLSERVKERTRDRNRIWQNSRDLLAVLDLEAHIRDVNPAWSQLLGYDEDALVGRPLAELLEGEPPALLTAPGGGGTSCESEILHADGSSRWISWTFSREGNSIYAYGRDTTPEREQAAALREAEAQLRQSQKMEAVGQLTGGIAHDFNNMLTGVIGALDIIRRRIASGRTEDIDRFMDAATTSAQRAAALTHRLLAFSRRQSLDRQSTDIAVLIGGMGELLARTLGEQVRLSVDVSGAWSAMTDANQLENAILNLAINARDAMPEGGELSISARNEVIAPGQIAGLEPGGLADFVVIRVVDSGSGMPPKVVEKAFDPFFTTKPIGQGTGLGLSMVFGFAQQSGGAVTIESAVGEGTEIAIYLPRSRNASDGAGRQATESVPVGAGESILVVEDDAAVRLLVLDVLRDLGYEAREAIDAARALDLFASGIMPDLLITDVGLPDMNGRQLAEIARDRKPDLKILFITGYAAGATDRREFLAEGMEMITKPFDLEKLASKVRQMLDRP